MTFDAVKFKGLMEAIPRIAAPFGDLPAMQRIDAQEMRRQQMDRQAKQDEIARQQFDMARQAHEASVAARNRDLAKDRAFGLVQTDPALRERLLSGSAGMGVPGGGGMQAAEVLRDLGGSGLMQVRQAYRPEYKVTDAGVYRVPGPLGDGTPELVSRGPGKPSTIELKQMDGPEGPGIYAVDKLDPANVRRVGGIAPAPVKPSGDVGQFMQINGRMPRNAAELKAFNESVRPDPQRTAAERDAEARVAKLPEIQQMDPNLAYSQGWRMNEDGTVYTDVFGRPEKLPSPEKVLGKRSLVDRIKEVGEMWDDATEIMNLLEDPQVAADLGQFTREVGLVDRITGRWSNALQKWLQTKGYGRDSKTAEAITRLQRMASDERKYYLGAAVTNTELESVLAWMPEAGDNFETILNKMNVMNTEQRQKFIRWLDLYKNQANMTPFYEAFGLKRFDAAPSGPQRLKYVPGKGLSPK